ncbi:MAG: hypothetical protein N2234_05410, partial [Planctomycetota bacterium]|nr:hypothetical protein [Planctomycetota bacterium]
MKAILTVIVLFGLLIVGCGGEESGQPPEPKKKPEPTTEPKEPEKEGVQPTEPTEDEKQPDFKEKFINNFKSYWAEAEEGDWALYVTHLKQLALFVVSRVEKKGEDKIVYMRKRWFYPDGREIPPTKDDQPEPPPISVEEDTEMEKRSMAGAHVNLR